MIRQVREEVAGMIKGTQRGDGSNLKKVSGELIILAAHFSPFFLRTTAASWKSLGAGPFRGDGGDRFMTHENSLGFALLPFSSSSFSASATSPPFGESGDQIKGGDKQTAAVTRYASRVSPGESREIKSLISSWSWSFLAGDLQQRCTRTNSNSQFDPSSES